MKAKNVQVGSIIEDRDGVAVKVNEVWPNQGLGLGCVIVGRTEHSDSYKVNRYVDIDEEVRVITKP